VGFKFLVAVGWGGLWGGAEGWVKLGVETGVGTGVGLGAEVIVCVCASACAYVLCVRIQSVPKAGRGGEGATTRQLVRLFHWVGRSLYCTYNSR